MEKTDIFYNKDQINRIEVFRKQKVRNVVYLTATPKTFFKKAKPEGIYYKFDTDDMYCTLDKLHEKNMFFEDGIVYYKPHINFKLSCGHTGNYFFDSVEELDKFLNDLMLEIRVFQIPN